MKGGTRKKGSKWYYYFDAGKEQKRDKNGHLMYDEFGDPIYKRNKIERVGGTTKKEAEAALAKAINEYNNCGQVHSPTEITTSDYLDLWFDQFCKMNLRYNSQLDYIKTIENHLKPAFGKYRLKALNAASIQDYVNQLKVRGYAKSTLVNIFRTLSGALNYAVEPLHYIEYNPCDRVKVPRYEDGRQELHHFIGQDDIKKILERFPEDTPFYVPIMIGYYCGLRISECFGLRWDDIDLERKTISVNHQIVKRNYGTDVRQSVNGEHGRMDKSLWYFQSTKTPTSNRVVIIGDTLCRALKRAKTNKAKNRLKYGDHFTEYYLRPESDEKGDTIQRVIPASRALPVSLPIADMVCVRNDGSMVSPDSFKHVSRIVNHDMHIPFNFHSLRHTHATMLVQAGAPLKDVQERLGHADVQTTMNKYVHNTDAMRLETVEIFERVAGLT